MASEAVTGFGESSLPAGASADRGGLVEQTVFFFLLSQLRELCVERMVWCEEGLFAMQDRRVR